MPYSYSKERSSDALVRELEYPCPTCHGGIITLEIAEDRKTVRRASHYDCDTDCSVLRYQGAHDAEINAAIAEANRLEDDGAGSDRLADTATTSAGERRELDTTISREAHR